jgi:metallo-beta-lactamase class B
MRTGTGASDTIKKLTGAKYMVMEEDVPVVESGGKTVQYANDPTTLYAPTTVDRVLHDGDEVKLADAVLTAHLTSGHTKGCTTMDHESEKRIEDTERSNHRQSNRKSRIQTRR